MPLQIGPTEILSGMTAIVSILAFAMSVYSTKKTVEFNRRQREFIETNDELNKMLLDREEQESLSQKQADISANFIKVGSSNYRLKVFNRGRGLAHNVRIEFPSGNEILIEDDVDAKFPMPSLEPQQSVELIAAVCMDSPRRMEMKFVWDDQSGKNREKLLTIAM